MNEYDKVMNEELANYIKDLRYNKRNCTWRRVADEVAEKYPELGIIPGNQIEGMLLCNSAMEFLNEKFEDGWN
jgi:hypothetical protein